MPMPLSSLLFAESKSDFDPPPVVAWVMLMWWWLSPEEFLLPLPVPSSKWLLLLDGGEGGCGWKQHRSSQYSKTAGSGLYI